MTLFDHVDNLKPVDERSLLYLGIDGVPVTVTGYATSCEPPAD